MGVFLQTALFPGCDESVAHTAVEAAADNPAFHIDREQCKYAQTYEGTQVLLAGDGLGFAPLARALADLSENPVMLLYIYDEDYWGYDFCGGQEEDHFSTLPDCFGPVSPQEKQHLAGNPAVLSGWLPTWDTAMMRRYLVHWSDLDEAAMEETACPGDRFPYGDCWQMTDFMARLGFPWAFGGSEEVPVPPAPALPTLQEILAQNLPPCSRAGAPESPLLDKLPSALSPEYIRTLLQENGILDFDFASKNPEEIIEAVHLHRRTVSRPERDPLCQRLAVLAAFCAFWLQSGNAWWFLDAATYEPVYGSYEKPSDIYVLRARAALTDFTKHHRAIRDLNRLIELDPANRTLYQAELQRWYGQERAWMTQSEPRYEAFRQSAGEQKRQENEREARRLQLILEKRRKKKR